MTPTLTFTCNICAEPSTQICVYCTKDACANHLCDRCRRCSDCCECEVRLEDHPPLQPVPHGLPHHNGAATLAEPGPEGDPAQEPEDLPPSPGPASD